MAFSDGDSVIVVSPTGRDRRVVAKGASPHWSPDGRYLLYVRRDDQGQVINWFILADDWVASVPIGPWAQAVW
jgi:Tol biopolymer transport system component